MVEIKSSLYAMAIIFGPVWYVMDDDGEGWFFGISAKMIVFGIFSIIFHNEMING